ncbi:MAG: NAD-dependent epimerase/dehydratase family protein [Anaerolineae bacterium]
MAIALVTGATGFIGSTLIRYLLADGYEVRGLAIDPPSPGLFPDSIQVLIGDIADSGSVQSAVTGVDVVFHLAAKLHVVDPQPDEKDEFWQVNVEGTQRVIDAAEHAGVQRVVFFSTINVYGPSRPGILLDEDSPLRPRSIYAETKRQAEEIALQSRVRGTDATLAVVLRLATAYGPGMKGNYVRLVKALHRRRFIPIGSGNNRRTLVHVNDVSRAAVLAGSHPDAGGRTYNVSDGKVHTMQTIISAICEALGRQPSPVSLPVGPVRVAAGISEDVARLVGFQAPIGRKTIAKYTEDVAVRSDRIQAELGFVPEVDLATGWRTAVAELTQSEDL